MLSINFHVLFSHLCVFFGDKTIWIFYSFFSEKAMAFHSSVLAWRIPGTGEPGRLPSMGSHRVGHDWSDLAAASAATWNEAEHYLLKNVPSEIWTQTGQLTELFCFHTLFNFRFIESEEYANLSTWPEEDKNVFLTYTPIWTDIKIC